MSNPLGRGRGRPSRGDRVEIRLHPAERAAVRRWAEERPEVDRRDGRPVEADAIRQMVVRTLAVDGFLPAPAFNDKQED